MTDRIEMPDVHNPCRRCGEWTAPGYAAYRGRVAVIEVYPCPDHEDSGGFSASCDACQQIRGFRCADCHRKAFAVPRADDPVPF